MTRIQIAYALEFANLAMGTVVFFMFYFVAMQ